jgi:hypothetical protein
VALQAVATSADNTSNPIGFQKAAFLYRIKFPFDAVNPR